MSRRTLIALALTSSYSLVTILLVSLRLGGVIDWSWLWILSPLWLPRAITGITFAGLAMWDRIEEPTRRAFRRRIGFRSRSASPPASDAPARRAGFRPRDRLVRR